MKYKYPSITSIVPSFRKLGFLTLLTLLVILSYQFVLNKPRASAVTYNYTSYLMDDSTFRASFTMNASAIQTFLQNEGSGLASFSDTEVCGTSTVGAMMPSYSSYYSCGTVQSAAQIIYDTSQAYGINPQVLLATMQKEQSLVTTPNPTASQLDYAMGYGCPDSSGCATYPGFFTQLAWAAWQFRYNYEAVNGNAYGGYSASSYPCNGPKTYYSASLVPGNSVTFYDDYGTGYATFTIPDAATASLYCYTPHVFPGSSQEFCILFFIMVWQHNHSICL